MKPWKAAVNGRRLLVVVLILAALAGLVAVDSQLPRSPAPVQFQPTQVIR